MADDNAVPDGTPTQPEQPTAPVTPPAPERTFTQTELNQLIAERLKRERDKHADYDQLKAAADELAKIKESQLSETEKLTRKLAELEAAKSQAEARARETLIRSAVISEAAKLGFNDPEDAYHLINVSTLSITDDGTVSGVTEAVKVLAEQRKYLIKSTNPALASFNPAGAGAGVGETDAQKRARIYGGGGSMFDAGRAAERGGGVIVPKGGWPE